MSMEQEVTGTGEKLVGKAKKVVGLLTREPSLAEEGRTDEARGEARIEVTRATDRVKSRLQRIATAVLSGIGRVASGTAKDKTEG